MIELLNSDSITKENLRQKAQILGMRFAKRSCWRPSYMKNYFLFLYSTLKLLRPDDFLLLIVRNRV